MKTLFQGLSSGGSGRTKLLVALTHSVRCLNLNQVTRLLPNAKNVNRAAHELITRLACKGLVEIRTVMVHPPLRLTRPMYLCASSTEPPDLDALAYQAQSRWPLPPERTVVVRATPRAAAVTGGLLPVRRSDRDTELAHDLTLSEIYLEHYYCKHDAMWIPEDALLAEGWARHDGHVPDAVIRSPVGEMVLELAGLSYSARRLAEVHRAFRDDGYELW